MSTNPTTLHDVAPREVAGRDTILRFSMQHQAAAYAALAILENGEIDRVYCDYHDDFVIRRKSETEPVYHFFQVKTKTKGNYQWTLGEVFGLRKRGQKEDAEGLRAIRESFAGKLFVHALTFKSACSEVTLLTNVHFTDDVLSAIEGLKSNVPPSKAIAFLLEKLGNIFDVPLGPEASVSIVRKLSVMPAVKYIGEQQTVFAVEAREAIFKYSEIDLTHPEANEIAADLVTLVQNKSIGPLSGLTAEQLDDATGVGLSDLLSILSISPEAYEALIQGDDPKALRTASFLQRRLTAAGAEQAMIEFATQKKVEWDLWQRQGRHTYSEMDLNFLFEHISLVRRAWLQSGGELIKLREMIADALATPIAAKFSTLSDELLFGAIMADWVRKESA